MSTEGAGKVCLTIGSPLVLGIGAGVLVGQGIMWCGDQLEKWSNRFAEEYAAASAAARAQQYAQVGTLKLYLSTQIEAMTLAQPWTPQATTNAEPAVNQEEMNAMLAQMRTAVTDARKIIWSPEQLERAQYTLQLRTEMATARAVLPDTSIQQAEQALAGPGESIVQALNTLRAARLQAEARIDHQDRLHQQMLDLDRRARAQLKAAQELVRESGSKQDALFATQRRAIEDLLARADAEPSPAQKLALLTLAHEAAGAHVESISAHLLDAWSTTNGQINRLQGTLEMLRTMLEEARRALPEKRAALGGLLKRTDATSEEARSLGQQTSLNVQQRLSLLNHRVEMLKQDVFNVIEVAQQRTIADACAATLEELHFTIVSDGPALQENGETLRITAKRSAPASQELYDDRLVSFDISRHGGIAYDFSGYAGSACVEEAREIFAALRKRGVFILEPEEAERLQMEAANGKTVTRQTLLQSGVLLEPAQNKLQTELAERLHTVLERMQYQHITRQAIGGCIELEAFNGTIGYRVVLDSDGTLQVYQDDETSRVDISQDELNPLVAEARLAEEERAPDLSTPRRPRQSTHHRLPQSQSLQE